jgi:hypothetical protein
MEVPVNLRRLLQDHAQPKIVVGVGNYLRRTMRDRAATFSNRWTSVVSSWIFLGRWCPVLRSVSSRVLWAASLASFSDAVKLGGWSLLVPSRESRLRVNLSLRRKICAS